MSELRLVGLRTIPEIRPGDDLGALIAESAARESLPLEDGDILVVTQKVVSKAENQLIDIETIEPSPFAIGIAERFNKDARRVEVVLRESRRIVRMDRGILITETHHGFICANSGVDESNVGGHGVLALLPKDPDASAHRIRNTIKSLTGKTVGIIVSDTFGRPWRAGLTDVALGVAGINPIDDWRGRTDAYGYDLRVTQVAVADELASAAELAAGKIAGIPVVVIRGFVPPAGEGSGQDLVRAAADDMFR